MSEQVMKVVLKAAGVYNIVWGTWVILFPDAFFELVGMPPLNHPMVWQGMGMVIGVYGLGYWWASQNPIVHWPIIAVGLLGKIFGPIGFLWNYVQGNVSSAFGYTLITNDLIWWVPFFIILRHAYNIHNNIEQ